MLRRRAARGAAHARRAHPAPSLPQRLPAASSLPQRKFDEDYERLRKAKLAAVRAQVDNKPKTSGKFLTRNPKREGMMEGAWG